MRDYRRSAHTVHAVHCHFVFCPKYRKPVLRGEVGQAVRKQIQEICRGYDLEILQGHVRPDHVHLLLSIPPHLSPSRVMQAVKGKTSHRLLMNYRRWRQTFWGRHLWARGYFVASSGNVTDETIAEYIRVQDADPTVSMATENRTFVATENCTLLGEDVSAGADILPVMPVGRVGLDAGSGATGVLANTRRDAAEPAVT